MHVLSPFTEHDLELSDHALGERLLEKYVAAVAAKNKLDPELLHPEFFKAVVEAIAAHDVGDAKLVGLEKALKKAASGKFSSAGNLLRSYLIEGAKELFMAEQLLEKIDKNLRGPLSGAKKSAKNRQAEKEPRNRAMRQHAEVLFESGRKPAEVKRILGKRYGLGPKQVGRIINE